MSAIEAVTLLVSSGVFTGGLGVLKWALSVEKRINYLELKIEKA